MERSCKKKIFTYTAKNVDVVVVVVMRFMSVKSYKGITLLILSSFMLFFVYSIYMSNVFAVYYK